MSGPAAMGTATTNRIVARIGRHGGLIPSRMRESQTLRITLKTPCAPVSLMEEPAKLAGAGPPLFCSLWGIASHFQPRHHLLPARAYRQEMAQRFQPGHEITGTARAASELSEAHHPLTTVPEDTLRMTSLDRAREAAIKW